MASHLFRGTCVFCQAASKLCLPLYFPSQQIKRTFIGKDLKRFYKIVSITQSDGKNGGYEVNLDKRKLKTPLGNLFRVPNEALALAVAGEWQAQSKVIKRHTMHMTSLCNTAIDNPSGRSRDTVIKAILEFLATDTVCYRLEQPLELAAAQREHWDPLLAWLKDRYDVHLEPTTGIAAPHVPEETKDKFRQHLQSHSDWALVGYQSAVECVKSLAITCALVDRHINVERAVQLSRLEQEFQISQWGNVEWYHDVELMELRARLAASVLFVHLNRESSTVVGKQQIRTGVS